MDSWSELFYFTNSSASPEQTNRATAATLETCRPPSLAQLEKCPRHEYNRLGAYMNVFAIKMAGVFIFSTSMIVFRTAILPRWVAFSGFACAVVLLLIITSWPWIALLFPLWVLIVSTRILIAEFHPVGRDSIPSPA